MELGYKPRARGRFASWLREYTQMQLSKGKNRRPDKPEKNGKSDGTGFASEPCFYRPSDKEPFMNERQRDYFRLKLLNWREDILKEAKETLQHLQDESQNHPDLADRASSETDRAIELRARDRQRKLIAKIDAALQRIEDGTYGYCEETGEPITLKRLEARPIATLSIEAQERHERRERVYRDD
jgi:DnaK suppressor protein